MPESRNPLAGRAHAVDELLGDLLRRAPDATRFWQHLEHRAHSSAVPRTTGPAPRIPAATAWSEAGSAASVMRAATLRRHHPVLGDKDEEQVEEVALLRVGWRPVSRRWKYSVKLSLPMRSPVKSRPRTSTRSGYAWAM